PVVQILAEPARRDTRRQVPVGGRDDADVHLPPLRAADGTDLMLLEDAQPLRLQRGRDVADLVEEDRAAVGLREEAGCVGDGAGEGAADVPEELALEERLGERGTVDGDERPLATRAVAVDRPRDELLPGPALARHEDRARSGGDARDR